VDQPSFRKTTEWLDSVYNTQAPDGDLMHYWQALALAVISGLGGGFISAVASLLDPGKTEKGYEATNGVSLSVFIWGRGLLGIGGAFAVMLAIIVAGRYKDETTSSNLLFLTSTCIVAGFVGQRVLSAVAKRVEDQIADEVDRKTQGVRDAVEKVVEEKARETQVYANIGDNIIAALGTLNTRNFDPTAIGQHIKDLESARQLPAYRTHRTLNIVLARLYADGKRDYDRAIAILTEFVEEKAKQGPPDIDLADGYYNIACYKLRKMLTTSGGAADELRAQALQALEASVRIAPQNAEDAVSDRDFDPIHQDPAFKKITAITGEVSETALPSRTTSA
jgi:hypothetical protein